MKNDNSEICIFLDDGGVMNNDQIRGKQWQKLIGKYFSPKFGGKPDMWGIANKRFITEYMNNYREKISKNIELPYSEIYESYIEEWINSMFDSVGIDRPKREKYREIYYNTIHFIVPKLSSDYPGVTSSIEKLYNKNYTLCTASGSESLILKLCLDTMGVKSFFTEFFGPDLVNISKRNNNFYEAIFKKMGIKPNYAIVVDDQPFCLNNARKTGTHVVQACLTGEYSPQFPDYITDIKFLPEKIEKIIEEIKI